MKISDLDSELYLHLRLLAIVAGVLLVSAAGLGWFGQSDGSGRALVIAVATILFAPVILVVMVLIAAVLARAGLSIASRLDEPGQRRLAAGSAPVILVLGVTMMIPAMEVAGKLRLQFVLSGNLGRLERLRTAPEAGPFTWANGTKAGFSIDRGPPQRAYFTLGAMADNSNGILYDPTGRVAAALGWAEGQRFTAPDEIRKLFGGDLLHCSPIRGHYYFCGFT